MLGRGSPFEVETVRFRNRRFGSGQCPFLGRNFPGPVNRAAVLGDKAPRLG